MLKDSEQTERAERPDIGRLIERIARESRDWSVAEARLARVELAALKAQAVRCAALAGVAVAALLCMLVALTQAVIAGVKNLVAAEGLAELCVALGFAVIAALCVVFARRSFAWRTESIFFRWLGSHAGRSGG